ncbi:BURP domain protein RD22 isoform X2 [Neltuma alba]|uniref:BURP domain protein RD22 isoform X2 n=1 Tax=Neltuma alba TaxID=207710 RepID=UPI0010A35A99|nr:BURP domain protein RD22-like isoform X2 [Prosopis alba]
MKFPLLSIIVFLTIVLAATHAILSPEMYWKSKLPNTLMPEPLKDLLHPTGFSTSMLVIVGLKGIDKLLIVYPRILYGNRIFQLLQRKTQLHYNNSNESLFFLEKDLKAGHKMNLLFVHTSNHASFLPRQVVKSIPFSSSKFAVKPGSVAAEFMEITMEVCEEPGMKGEEKYCATSLESMVDFVTLKLGNSVNALSTGTMNQTKELEEYTIMHRVKKVAETQVVCHKLNYAYAVFYCHKIENTVAYAVPLEGADGSRMEALSVCHRDTSHWDSNHLAFQLLKVKPGSVPVCHFLYQNTVMWVPKQN